MDRIKELVQHRRSILLWQCKIVPMVYQDSRTPQAAVRKCGRGLGNQEFSPYGNIFIILNKFSRPAFCIRMVG